MISEDIKKKVIHFCGDLELDEYMNYSSSRVYSYMFGEIGETYRVYGEFKEGLKADNMLNMFGVDDELEEETCDGDERKFNPSKCTVSVKETLDNIKNTIGGIIFYINPRSSYIISDDLLIQVKLSLNGFNGISFTTSNLNKDDIVKTISESIVYKKKLNSENTYKIAYKGQYAIETSTHKFNKWTTDIKKNYNDDLPYKEMNAIIRRDKAGLMMFYGAPGTGKTSLIKTLINDNREVNFIFIDSAMCDSISDGMLLDFLQDNKNSVFVFEDCEKLLASRDNGGNDRMSTILNLTDGIIAESMKIKFICTFNCSLDKVDKALLRKGRLSLKYEFKELSLEKSKAINPNATKPMTLADLHMAQEKNDFSEEKKRTIGFSL